MPGIDSGDAPMAGFRLFQATDAECLVVLREQMRSFSSIACTYLQLSLVCKVVVVVVVLSNTHGYQAGVEGGVP